MTLSLAAGAQTAPAPAAGMGPSPAEQAIRYRQSVFQVISGNFRPFTAVMQGRAEYNAAELGKAADRLAFVATMVGDTIPDISKGGKTMPALWTDKAGFAKASQTFVETTAALSALLKQDKTNSAAFKAAVAKVGDSCKGCHDNFREQ